MTVWKLLFMDPAASNLSYGVFSNAQIPFYVDFHKFPVTSATSRRLHRLSPRDDKFVLEPRFHWNDSNGLVADLSRDFSEPSRHVAMVWTPEASPRWTRDTGGLGNVGVMECGAEVKASTFEVRWYAPVCYISTSLVGLESYRRHLFLADCQTGLAFTVHSAVHEIWSVDCQENH